MERKPNGKYTKEFREEAVKLVTIKGHSIDDTAKKNVLTEIRLGQLDQESQGRKA